MSIQYKGDDGRIHSLGDNNSLRHWKYIKKIQTGSGPRYFYTMEELRAYYDEMKGKAEDKWRYAKPQKPSTMQKTLLRDDLREQKRWLDERERIRKSDRKMDRELERAHEDYNRNRNSKNWNKLEDTRIKARDTIYKDNIHSFMKNENKHDEEKRKIADRRYNLNRYKKATQKISDMKNSGSKSIEKGRSKVEKKLNKAKKTAKSEAKGVKRASNAIRGKGNNFYDAHDTAPKSYSSYDKKKKKFGKNKKTGRAERAMIYAYRRTHPNE